MKMVGPAAMVALVLSSVSAMKDAASPMSASSLIHARTVYEDQVHVQLARWCNATLPAQTSRRSALQRLLEQAQTTAGKNPKLVALEQEVAAMGDSLEKQRISAEAARASGDRHALEAKLDLSDASAEVKALSAAVKIIDGKQSTAGYKAAQGLLAQAQTTERQLQTKAQLLQTTGSSSGALAKTQAEYQGKRAEKDQLQHLYFTTQRSLGVLTSALEDESAYLSDLQSICGAEQHVERRLQGSTLPALNKVLLESEKPVPRAVSAIQVAPKVIESAPTAPPAPVVHEVATIAARASKKEVPPVSMIVKQDSATEEVVHPKKAAVVPPAPVAHAHVASKVKAVAQTPPPAADDDDSDDDAPAPTTTTTTLPKTTTQLKHKKHHKKHHKAAIAAPSTTTTPLPTTTAPPTTTAKPTPAATTTLSEDDAEQQAMEALEGPPKTAAAAPPAPKAAPAKKVAASSMQKTVKKHKHTTAAPADDDDSDDAPAPTTTAAPTQAPTTSAEPAAPADDDDLSHPKEGVQAFVAKKKKSHKKAKTEKKDEFLDGIYSAAAGYMPATYSAWKPEGASSAPHTPPPLAPGKNAMDSMKAMMDTGDDTTNIDQALKTDIPKHTKWAPSVPQAASQSQPAADAASAAPELPAPTAAQAAPAQTADADDPFDESPAANTIPTTTTTKAAPVSDAYDLTDDSDSSPPPKTTTQPPPPPPAAASKDPFADDDDSDAPPTTPPPHHHKKKHHTTTAAPDPLGDDDDDGSSAPAATTTVAPKPKVSLEQTSSSGDPNVPDQYSAWAPSDKPQDPKQNAMVQSFESGFDDGDASSKKKKHLRHKKHKTTTTRPTADSDGVVYDDDDLPKHHPKPFEGLEGGWKAFMKPAGEKKKPKLDADVQIMQNLYTDDGGLPGQYTAWTPASATTAAPASEQSAAASDDSDDGSDDGGDSFMQMESRKKVSDPVGRLIRDAVSAASDDADAPSALIEETTVAVDASRMQAANAVLAQFAQTLQSKPLQQLVQAKLSPPKLATLFQKLQSVDPLKHPSHSSEQAEQACLFFEDNAQSAAPVTQAALKVERGNNDAAEALSHQSALLEEMSARTQLQRTMEQDVNSLSTLLKTARQGQDVSGLSTAEAQLDKQGRTSSGAELGVAAEGVQAAHAELADLLELTLQKRSVALKTQQAKVALLQAEQKTVNSKVTQKRGLASQSETEMKAAEQKLSGIQTACSQALASLEQRRHTGHMEAHAIGTVLKVIGSL